MHTTVEPRVPAGCSLEVRKERKLNRAVGVRGRGAGVHVAPAALVDLHQSELGAAIF